MRKNLSSSELILNNDGSVYHLNLRPEHIANTVITVGDQARVKRISDHFDRVEYKISHREFTTHTGIYNKKRITVVSTGIGTDNIDIFLNELDAVVNIDLQKREIKDNLRSLNIIRLGTSGSIQRDVPVGSFVVSEYAVGLDGLAHYYDYPFDSEELEIGDKLNNYLKWDASLSRPYIVRVSQELMAHFGDKTIAGITATTTGFYAPQGRVLRLAPKFTNINELLKSFAYKNLRITNIEMETSGLYTLSKMLGHQCVSCSAIIANRATKEFAKNPNVIVDNLIVYLLEKIAHDPYFS